MKNLLLFALICSLMCCSFGLQAQHATIDAEFKKASIDRLSEMMIERYVFPEVAEQTAKHLKKKLKNGDFDEVTDLEAFAEMLTSSVQEINKDKHMRIRPIPARQAEMETPERMIDDAIAQLQDRREGVSGFKAVKKLDGNVGYLDIRYFASMQEGAAVADTYMKLLATSDAVIIDLRENGGGDPAMVQYLCSYFIRPGVHLNSLYFREGDVTNEFWTLNEIGGERMPDVPLFVLTSDYTFSGAEEFSYNMQTQKRAKLVGMTTGGGANPGGRMPINDLLFVFIPTGKAINPITGTNWEGTGVIPDVATSGEEAYDQAVKLATAAAEKYRNKYEEEARVLLGSMLSAIDEIEASDETTIAKMEAALKTKMKVGVSVNLIGEMDINMMGYECMQTQKAKAAEAVLKVNTLLFPNSANTYDSYGEALANNGKLEQAVKSYQKAIEIAAENEDPNITLYKQGLERVQQQMK
ncbi:MAG: C-terminal processing protease CtpA/Prc [Limisphaerales bacterium]|jgi:C-terminal processing protease CtpA/Prc